MRLPGPHSRHTIAILSDHATMTPDAPTLPGAAAAALPDAVSTALGAMVPALLRRDGDALAVKAGVGGPYLHVDATLLDWLGCAAEEMIGRNDAATFDAGTATVLRAADQAAMAHGGALQSEHKFERHGVRREFSVLRMRLDGGSGTAWLAAVWRDLAPSRRREAVRAAAIEQLEVQQRANEQLRRQVQDHALRDSETGLYNSAHFDDQLRREVDLSTREHREFALVSIELDPLTPEASSLGLAARPRVFEALGRLLSGNTRAMDASCRSGDTRFAVLLSGVGLATAHSRMEGLRRKCATQIVVHEGQELGFSVAVGVASFPHTAHTQHALVAACEAALAEAQRRGGNHVTLAAIRFEDH